MPQFSYGGVRQRHIYNPFTGEHLPECIVLDEIQAMMESNMRLSIQPLFIPKQWHESLTKE